MAWVDWNISYDLDTNTHVYMCMCTHICDSKMIKKVPEKNIKLRQGKNMFFV
jgi:hypothetical protein